METIRKRIENLDDIFRLAEFNEKNNIYMQVPCRIHGQKVIVEYERVNDLPMPIFIGCCNDSINTEFERRLK